VGDIDPDERRQRPHYGPSLLGRDAVTQLGEGGREGGRKREWW